MGKITVKHYLNKKLKETEDNEYPVYISITTNSINIKRKSHGLWSASEDDFKNSKRIKQLIEYERNLYTRIIKRLFEDIEHNCEKKELLYFSSTKGYNSKDEFINLVNAYIDFYGFTIFPAISKYCDNIIEDKIYKKLSDCFKINDIKSVKRIFTYNYTLDESDLILNNLDKEGIELLVLKERLRSFLAPYNTETGYDIPYIDWLDNLIQPKLVTFLKTYKRKSEYYLPDNFVFSDNLIDSYISLIDNIIKSAEYTQLARIF